MAEIIETKKLNDYEVWTDDGWINMPSIHKTIPYEVWAIETENFKLKCADKHILFDEKYNQIFAEDLIVGDMIWTESGLESIISIIHTGEMETMYDATVDSENHRLYTNGILSHNTTIMTIAALHEACFNDYKTIIIVANKESTAIEIFRRVRLAYEELPSWLKPAVKEYGKTGCEFHNGSRIAISTTTGSAIRGTSLNCISEDSVVTIKDKSTGEIREIEISNLYEILENSGEHIPSVLINGN